MNCSHRSMQLYRLVLQAFILCLWLAPHAQSYHSVEPLKRYLARLQADRLALTTLLARSDSPQCSPEDFLSILRSWDDGAAVHHNVAGASVRCNGDLAVLGIAFDLLRRQVLTHQEGLAIKQAERVRLRFKTVALEPPAAGQSGYHLRSMSFFGSQSRVNIKNTILAECSYKIQQFGQIMASSRLMALTDAPDGRDVGWSQCEGPLNQNGWPPRLNRNCLQIVQDGVAISCHRECLVQTYGHATQVFFIAPSGVKGKCSAWPMTGPEETRMRAPQLSHLFLIMAPAWATDQIMGLQLECYQSKDPLDLYGPYIAKILLPSYTTSLRLVILSIAYQFGSHDNDTVARVQDLAASHETEGYHYDHQLSPSRADAPFATADADNGQMGVVMKAAGDLLEVNHRPEELLLGEAVFLCRRNGYLEFPGWPSSYRSGPRVISCDPPSQAGQSYIALALLSGISKGSAVNLAGRNSSLGVMLQLTSMTISSSLGYGISSKYKKKGPRSSGGKTGDNVIQAAASELTMSFALGTFTVQCTPNFPLLLLSISRTRPGPQAVRPPLKVLPTINPSGPSSIKTITDERILLIVPSRILDLIQCHEADFELPPDQVVNEAYLQGLCDRILQWIPGRFESRPHPFLILYVKNWLPPLTPQQAESLLKALLDLP